MAEQRRDFPLREIELAQSHLGTSRNHAHSEILGESQCFATELGRRVEYFGPQGPGSLDFPSSSQAYFGTIVRGYGKDRIEVDWDHLSHNVAVLRSDVELR